MFYLGLRLGFLGFERRVVAAPPGGDTYKTDDAQADTYYTDGAQPTPLQSNA